MACGVPGWVPGVTQHLWVLLGIVCEGAGHCMGAAGHRMGLLGIVCEGAGHCTGLLDTVWDRTTHCPVPSGATQCRWATCWALHGAAKPRTVIPGGTVEAGSRQCPVPPRPLCPGQQLSAAVNGRRGLCRWRRIVRGARSPCPADGRYNKAACCGQANYLSNYDLPLNHMIFLQSCGQLKPG